MLNRTKDSVHESLKIEFELSPCGNPYGETYSLYKREAQIVIWHLWITNFMLNLLYQFFFSLNIS